MEEDLKTYQYGESLEDCKIKSFVEDSKPKQHMDIAAIKQKTFQKIHEEERKNKRRRMTTIVAAAASLLLIVGFGIGRLTTADHELNRQLAALSKKTETEVMQMIKVPVGEKATIILADGTKVVANSRTKLLYPKNFKGDTREVTVHGEAYFEVAHDTEHPFIVKANKFNVKVLGTRFNISSYDATTSNVVLVQGSVELTTQNTDVVRMKPSDKVDISDGAITQKTQVNPDDYISWMNGVINLHGETVRQITQRLSQHYGVKIVCDAGGDTPLYGKLSIQGALTDILNVINNMAGVKTVEKDHVIHLVSKN